MWITNFAQDVQGKRQTEATQGQNRGLERMFGRMVYQESRGIMFDIDLKKKRGIAWGIMFDRVECAGGTEYRWLITSLARELIRLGVLLAGVCLIFLIVYLKGG